MPNIGSAVVSWMRRGIFAVLLVAAAGALHSARAQNPSTQQVQQALSTRPGLGSTVRARIQSSGLTPDQIRQRLQAAGYPTTLLDAYMPGAQTDTSSAAATPDDNVMNAARFLGLVDSTEVSGGGAPAAAPVPAPAPTPPDTTTPIFGLSLFQHSTSQFQPALAGPVDPSYKVGPRDVLALIITGGVELSYSLEITREGFIVIPQVGQVYVANLTLDQVENALLPRLKSVYSGIGKDANATTHLYVTVAGLRTNQVFVVGDVAAPASYQVSSLGTMLTALYAAGGPTAHGSMRDIQLRRAGKVVSDLDVYDYLLKGDASHDARLETGDVIFVPVHGPRVTISGEVIRPATYELSGKETLQDLIRMAGGFTAQAGRQRVLVRRIVPPTERQAGGGRDRTVLDVASDDFRTGYGPAFPLTDGDQVQVFAVPDRVRDQISVLGAVWSPGDQGFTPGMKLSDAIRKAGGVKPDVKDVIVNRLQSDQTRRDLRVAFTDTLGTPAQDMLLQEDDSIRVFGTAEFRPDRYVIITGAINNGGRFPWHEGMTLRDLVHLAGGLDDGAYLVEAKVARLPETHEKGVLATTMSVPLDSTYLLERGLDGKYLGPPGIQAPKDTAPTFMLEPYDNVLILRQPDWILDRTVWIGGEVRFPGNYALRSKGEKLTSLIQRAGGLMPLAYADGAVFTRARNSAGRVAVNLPTALKDSANRDNITLMPGDSLFLPEFQSVVRIEGAVNSPISVAYVPGKSLTYYVDAAGGFAYTADSHRAYVRQPSGIVDPYKWRLWFIPDHDPKPLPGSTVVVPTKDPNDHKDWASISGSIAQVIVGTVGIIAIIRR